jgi:site-specific DNA recombinase
MGRKKVSPTKPEPKPIKKAAAYIRVSQPSQAKDDKISLEQQESKIKEYCAREGWEVSDVYRDAGKSGASMKDRTEMQRLLRDAETDSFNIVVTWDITRFGRSLRDTKNNIADLKALGIHLIALDQGIDTRIENKSNNLQLNILSSIAEYEHETIRDRTQSARIELLRRREIFLGQPPYGYFWNDETKRIEHHPEHSKVYRRIAQDYFTKSLPTITIELNNENAPRRRKDGRWHTSTVCNILRSEAHWRGVVYVEVEINGSKEIFDYPCEPLITFKDWKDVQDRLTNSNRRAGRPAQAAKHFLLHRKLRCGACGGRLGTWEGQPRKDRTRLRRYFCTWDWKPDKHLNGHPKCNFDSLLADDIEDFVFNELLKIIKGERYESFRDSDLPEKEQKLWKNEKQP